MSDAIPHGRGTSLKPPNRFERIHVDSPDDSLVEYFSDPDPRRTVLTKFYRDHTGSVLAKNDSPDLGFTYSINPYRGCEHGCIYCYARPSHEYLGFSSGIDFESKILVKPDAAKVLEEEFQNPSWQPQTVVFSGNTDCYQPVERSLELTRQCLRVFLKYRNPVSLITKNALVVRDLDILEELAALNLVLVLVSVTSLDRRLVQEMEPRTSIPDKRLDAIETLSNRGIPVGVNVAPVIPGLTDSEIPSILKAARVRGARYASYSILRLPGPVRNLFIDWLERELPLRAHRVLRLVRDVRDGKLSDSTFGKRMTGEGAYAEAIRTIFASTCRGQNFETERLSLSADRFVRPGREQMDLFARPIPDNVQSALSS